MKLLFTTLDVFTVTRYAGNPLAVVQVPASLKSALTQAQKQAIATEFNLSETVFLHLPSDSTSTERTIDIFTSTAEVPFAGHPTIGTSHYLLKILGEKVNTLITKAGRISIDVDEESEGVKAEIPQNFHRHSVTFKSSLSGKENPTASIVNGMSFILVELPDLESLGRVKEEGNLNKDTYNPSVLDEGWRDGLVGTMYFVSQGVDGLGRKRYRTRMFVSSEDPGTGSASSALGCYLALEDGGEGKETSKFVFEQGVEMGRRNEIVVDVVRTEDGKGIKKVLLSGEAVAVMEGTLEV